MNIRSNQFHFDLHDALQRYQGEPGAGVPVDVDSATCHERLSAQNVVDATVVLVNYFGLPGGSNGSDFDLYALLQAYLLDPSKRAAINAIL